VRLLFEFNATPAGLAEAISAAAAFVDRRQLRASSPRKELLMRSPLLRSHTPVWPMLLGPTLSASANRYVCTSVDGVSAAYWCLPKMKENNSGREAE